MDTESEKILKHYTTKDGLPPFAFTHLHEDTDGIFWLSSKGGGLIRWEVNKNKVKQFTQADGLSNNVLYAVYEDDYDNLWLPSNYGLMQFDKKSTTTKVYLPNNGIPHEEFNTHAHFQAPDGTLYFGGLNGVVGFHPKDILEEETTYEPPLYLTSAKVLANKADEFKVITKEYAQHKAIELAPDYQNLALEFSLLDYESMQSNQYAYQITGYQDRWIYINENKIDLFKIPYGDYTVNIKARNSDGAWSKQLLQIPLKIRTPFYLQWWFLLSMASLAMFGVMGYIKRREINLQKDKEHLEQEVQKRTATIAKQAEELQQLDKAKTRFFSNITHEFRTPLTLVIGPLQQMITEPTPTITPKRLGGVLKNAQQILYLINQLLDISKLESGKMEVEVNRGDLIAFTQELVDGFQDLAKQKNQRLVFHTKSKIWETHFDKDKWHKIIYNVLFNAIKFTPNNGAIQLSLTKLTQQKKEWIHFKIKDSGIGIATGQVAQIFNRFYQTDNSTTRKQDGTGIGLALVKELVELQEGEIWVTSRKNLGTTFDIQIPIPQEIPSVINEHQQGKQEIEIPILEKSIPLKSGIKGEITKNQVFRLLIIEDNVEMLNYIQSCIDNQKYSISSAKDGLEGIQKAQAIIPDLIISDVMMPIKDGFEVTKTIRGNIVTSHIPIILLTAKAALRSKLEGINQGADAYLTKPFSPEELSLRINKLIENRQLLQKRYQDNLALPQEPNPTFEKEDIFILRLNKYLFENLGNPDLTVEDIAKSMKISRMQLHRKLKALTNQSTTTYIQNIRLKESYKLLAEQNLNVSEIAYQTGFSNPYHFSRVFKKKYGVPPSKAKK